MYKTVYIMYFTNLMKIWIMVFNTTFNFCFGGKAEYLGKELQTFRK